MFCQNCGTQIDNARFCPKCGTSINLGTTFQHPQTPPFKMWQTPASQSNITGQSIPVNFNETDYKQCMCHYSTPEHNNSLIDTAIKMYISKGTLTLDRGTLSYTSDKGSFSFPINSIVDIRIEHYSRLQKPIKLNFIAIRYRVGFKEETICLSPMTSSFDSVWETNKNVDYWMSLIKSYM
jgi:hypothetical protein